MAQITKIVDFAAAHSIQGAGKCANKHGHNWEATIQVETVGGVVDHRAGFIADVADLKKCAFKYDHDDLDNYFEYASTENVAKEIAIDALEVVKEANPRLQVFVRVHLVETKNNSADAVATNADIGELNKSSWSLKNPDNGETTTLGELNYIERKDLGQYREVGLKGAAQDLESEFDKGSGSMKKPEADRKIQFGGAQFDMKDS